MALTGGIASGKTTISNMFAELGVPIIDSDVIAREVMTSGTVLLERIFDRFYRGEASRRREESATGGAGLGLAIARGLVQAHQGRIWAERSPLGGMSVQIQLPMMAVDDQPRRGAATGASAGTLSSMSRRGSGTRKAATYRSTRLPRTWTGVIRV